MTRQVIAATPVTNNTGVRQDNAVDLDALSLPGLTLTGALTRTDVENGITAHAGGGQASGYAITKSFSRITTVTTGNDSVTLPAATVGACLVIANAAGANSANVFPASGEAINVAANDAAFALASGKTVMLFCIVAGKWSAILSA